MNASFSTPLQACDGAGVRMAIAGLAVRLRPSGALWLEDSRTLAVADLHLEKGSSYAARGQMLPPYDTVETLARLAREIEALAPAAIVLLGDTFHDNGGEARLTRLAAEGLASMAQSRRFIWVVGNHDTEGPRQLPGEATAELTIGRLILRHEPMEGPRSEAAGHLHPAAKVSARGRTVRRRCFVTDGERVVLPAFGAYAGGLNVKDAAFKGLFAGKPIVVALGEARAHPIAWSSLARG